ncbi:MAG TPA: 5'-3' exonuclease [Pseudonocardiaceae bacterium]
MTAPLVLLDSASMYFRAFYGVPDSMRSPDGMPVNAVRGFTDMVARIVTERRPARLVACLDADWRPAFRVALLPSYKAHRVADEAANAEEVPDTLSPQIPIILDVLAAFGIATAEAAGHEADDVIGTLTARERTHPVEAITGDRDLFQVVRDKPTPARVIYLGKGGWQRAEVIGPIELAAKYDLPEFETGPAYADMALLRGDPSDGLPGVAGIGEKTAAKLLTEFGSLTGLLEATVAGDRRVPPRIAAKLAESADYLTRAPGVVRVVTDASIDFSGPDPVPASPADPDRLASLAERWGLDSSVRRLTEALAVNAR